jgi:hypothetical protein
MKGEKYNDIYTEKSYHLRSSREYHALTGDNENNQRDDRLPCFDFAGICIGISTSAIFVHCVQCFRVEMSQPGVVDQEEMLALTPMQSGRFLRRDSLGLGEQMNCTSSIQASLSAKC